MAGPNFHKRTEPTAIPRIGVGVIGYGGMGRAHALAYNRLVDAFWPPSLLPRLIAVCGRHEDKAAAAAQRYGFAGYYTSWSDLVADEDVQVVDVCTQPYAHLEIALAALKAGKHVLCEKPLAADAREARRMWQAARTAGVTHMTGFNYRFVPALALARRLLDSGALGQVRLVRVQYLQEFRNDPTLPAFANHPEGRGRGVLNNLGCHVVDIARFLAGNIATVAGSVRNHIPRRPSLTRAGQMVDETEDDTFHCVAEFANGASGVLEGSQVATGRKNQLLVELNCSHGSLRFDLERLNELQLYMLEPERPEALGFRDILVTEGSHPFVKHWWPRGHLVGWEATFVHEVQHFLACVMEGRAVGPEGATFEDGLRAALVAASIAQSSTEGRRVAVEGVE